MFYSVGKMVFILLVLWMKPTEQTVIPILIGSVLCMLCYILCLRWLFFFFEAVLPVTDGQLIDQYFMQGILKASFWGLLHSVSFPSILWELLFFLLKMFTGQKCKGISSRPLCVYYGSLNLYCFPNSPETSCWTSYER